MPERVRAWHHLTSAEARARAEEDPVVVVPLAAVEQHGPHLPLSTDLDIGRGILDEAFRALDPEFPAYALPFQPVGVSLEHADRPGTITLPTAVLEEVVHAMGSSLARSGVRRVVLFNSHGGNRATIDSAALRLRSDHGLLVVKASWFRFPRPDSVELPEAEWEHGLHGGAVETAMMMHLRPELVRASLARRFPSLGQELAELLEHIRPEGPVPFAWLARDLNPDGVVGDAAVQGGADVGRRLVEHYGRYLAEVLGDARDFPLGRLAGAEE